MEADASKAGSVNPCCAAWRTRYVKLEEKRNALRQGVQILQGQIERLQAENLSLKKACDEARARADSERTEKEKECSHRISVEDEIAALRSEMSSLQNEGGPQSPVVSEELLLLRGQISTKEMEVNWLRQLLEEERAKANMEKERAKLEKQKDADLRETSQSEKNGAAETSNLAYSEVKKAEEAWLQLERLRNEVNEARSSLALEKSRLEEANQELDLEKMKVLRERTRADEEKAIVVKQRKLAEENANKVIQETCHANNLLTELEGERQKVESLQKELLELRSSIESVEDGGSEKNADVINRDIRGQISERDAEISQLKQLLEEEKVRAHMESEKVEVQKSRVIELCRTLECEKNRVDEAHNMADAEAKKAKDYRAQLEILKKEINESRTNLALEKLKCENLNKRLEAEKQKVLREKQRADLEKAIAAKMKKLVEANEKKVMEERCNANNLSQQLEDERQKIGKLQKEMHELTLSLQSAEEQAEMARARQHAEIEMAKAEEQRKLAEMCSKMAMEEKSRADNLSQQLEKGRQRFQELEKELHQLQLSGGLAGTHVDVYMNAEAAKLNLLHHQLKFEKKRVKHAKQVAKLEKGYNIVLQQELHRLKHDLAQILCRLDMPDNTFCYRSEDLEGRTKTNKQSNRQALCLNSRLPGVRSPHMHHHEHVMASSSAKDASDCLMPTVGYTQPQICVESLSGTKTKLEPLLGSSHREILPSSAISSSTASFSDKQLMGSQGKVAGSLTTSATLSEDLSNPPSLSRWSAEGGKRKYTENLVAVAENSIRSSLSKVPGHIKKKRKILDEFESIKCLQHDSQRLHQELEGKLAILHNAIQRLVDQQTEGELLPNEKGDPCAHRDESCKKRKASKKSEVIMPQLYGSNKTRTERLGDPAVTSAVLGGGSSQGCRDNFGDMILSNKDALNFEEVTDGDFMKLLYLDSMADEEAFQRALERPLSPTLPEIDFQNSGKGHMDWQKGSPEEGCNAGCFPNELVRPCSFDVLNTDSRLKRNCDILERSEVLTDPLGTKSDDVSSRACQVCRLAEDVGMSEMQVSENNGINSCGSELGSAYETTKLFCVVFSYMDEDITSRTRIFCATRACIAQCFWFTPTTWALQDLLVALASQRQLTPREQVCVLFSLFLHNYYGLSSSKLEELRDQRCVDSFSAHVISALSSANSRSVFTELCDLSELVNLIEDFVVRRRILFPSDIDSELCHGCSSRFEIFLEDKRTLLCPKMASTHQLVAAGVILASICSAMNEVGRIFEFSLNVLYMSSKEPFLMLSLLHVFANVCGERYFKVCKYGAPMAVVRTMVRFFENASIIEGSAGLQPVNKIQPQFPPCMRCPFLEGSKSPEDTLSLLWEELQSHYLMGKTHENLKISANYSDSEPLCMGEDLQKIIHGASAGVPVAISNSGSIDNFGYCGTILSFLELISSIMNWDWTYNKVVSHLLKMLESSVPGNFSTSIVLLVGQLGRQGVEASGYNDERVENIKLCLSSLLRQLANSKCDSTLLIATSSALLGLSLDTYEELLHSNVEFPDDSSHPTASEISRKCLSSLSSEQISFLLGLQDSAGLLQSKDSSQAWKHSSKATWRLVIDK
ncbi:hypothetical protein Ancab_009597 [Ancistrocladus abbreviatus]